MKKLFLSLLSVFCLVLLLSPLPATAEGSDKTLICSGKCGADLTYEFYSDGVLIISGTGDMYKNYYKSQYKSQYGGYEQFSSAPWGVFHSTPEHLFAYFPDKVEKDFPF